MADFTMLAHKKIIAAIVLLLVQSVFATDGFVHPGLLQSRADLERIKAAVTARQEPIYSGYQVFRADPHSDANYKMRGPLAMVGRNPTVGQADYDSDANAAYQCAIMWCITGNRACANKSKAILNAWSANLKSITGRDAVLMAGLGPFKMVNAAEIIRYTDASWSPAEIQQTAKHFRQVIYPVIKDFAPFANGNWDTAAIKTMMAIGVFCDDREMFERALRYYVDGSGDGSLAHYIINDAGQCQESGRDQQHTQLGLAHLGDDCEIAWHQGLDLYGYDDNRLLQGFEYAARYNLGESVPFAGTLDRTGKYHHRSISTDGRGRFRAVYEEIYNHYVNRQGLAAPFTARAVQQMRPEGAGHPGADHVGYGTLLFAQTAADNMSPPQNKPLPPGGLIADGTGRNVRITWVSSVGAKSYTVKRATQNGEFEIIAGNLTTNRFTDFKIKPGDLYRYSVSAGNALGESADACPVAICAGLPEPWQDQDVGSRILPGKTGYDGNVFNMEGAGQGIGGTQDAFHFTFTPTEDDCVMVARFVPQPSSQRSQFGLMMRESSSPGAANVALVFDAPAGGQIEAPEWSVHLSSRASSGGAAVIQKDSPNIPSTVVTYGRLTGSCWLKLERSGNIFNGYVSLDGKTWTRSGTTSASLAKNILAGLAVSSRMPQITTTVRFDHVTVKATPAATSAPAQIESPDGKVAVKFSLQAAGVPAYRVDYSGQPVVLESRLGLQPDFTNGFTITKISRAEHHGDWSQVYGERKIVPDDYRELSVGLKNALGNEMEITFRAYNEGAAFRYTFPNQTVREFHFTGEQSEFRFPQNTLAYEEHGTEGEYQRVNVSSMKPWCERPLTLEQAGGWFVGLGEAANQNFPRMLLSPLSGVSNALVSALGGTTSNTAREQDRMRNDSSAVLAAGASTPWRFFIIGEKPGDLLEHNYLMLDLNPPLALKDVSWIQPGKVMRDTTLTTTNSKAIIDFAATAGLQYVLLDDRWYGTEDAEHGDATTVRVKNLDIPEIIRYGRAKNVGLILYVDRRQLKTQRDVLFPLYEKWGVKGVKIGFVDVGPQTETAWITETVEKAAEHHLVVNIHDGYRTTGLARTYPNLLTVEGVRGNEHFPTPEHNCTLPFTRYLAGSADYTVCYYDGRLQTTHAQQLAMAVVSYSPLQSILWYDRPGNYHGEPEMEFFRQVPTVWDDTKVLNGEIGKYATIARRSGEAWFVGTINDREARLLKVPLSFLNPARKYEAHVYYDDPSVATRTKVGVKTLPVTADTVLDMSLSSAGGEALWITPSP